MERPFLMFSRPAPKLLANPSSIFNSGGAADPPAAASADDSHGRRSYSSWDEDREATRYLSAHTLLSISYAKDVVSKVVNERFRALAPSYGVDVAAVAKWALGSLRLRARRDRDLTTVLLAGLLLFITLIFLWPWASIIAAALTLALGWAVVVREYMARLKCVGERMLRGRFVPSTAPEPPVQAERDRLAMVSKRRAGNLVVFRGHRAFVGSGYQLSKEHLLIDVSRGKTQNPKSGKPAKPERFTNEEVHAAIISAMRKLGLADLRVEERLFVNGRHIQNSLAVLPKPKEPPSASVDCAVLKHAALHPTPDARVYVCVEMPSWQGQLVVTLFARAVHIGGSLYIEWRFHALLPVKRSFQNVDNLWSEPRGRLVRQFVRYSVGQTAPAMFGAPVRIWRARRDARFARKNEMSQAYAIDHGQVFHYGADSSIRELASGSARQHYFLSRDEAMFVLLAQEKLIRTISRFLDKKNIDAGQIKSQVEFIINETNNHYSMHVGGNISDSSIAIGNKAQATGSPPGK